MDSGDPDEQRQVPEVSSSRTDLPDDPNDDYYLTHCFVCQEQAKPGQVKQIQLILSVYCEKVV